MIQMEVPADKVMEWLKHLVDGGKLTGIDYTEHKWVEGKHIYYTINTLAGNITVSLPEDTMLALLMIDGPG